MGGVGKSRSEARIGEVPGPGEVGRPDRFPEWLFSCGGREQSHRRLGGSPTLEGLCEPEAAKRSWLFREVAENDRSPSRFSSESGTQADVKQEQWAFCVFARRNGCVGARAALKAACAAEGRIVPRFEGPKRIS